MTEWKSLRRESGSVLDLVFLTAIWLVMTWIAKPIGNFPLNDDWAYAISVKTLVEEGRLFFLTEWANKTLVAHVFWGALFCLPFGFTYTALRVSQLTAGLIGIFALYQLCLELGASRRTSMICAATLLANPLYFQISNTFMTDVSFTAFMTLAMVWIFRGMLKRATPWSIAGWTLLVLTVWVRELAAMIPAGYAAMRVYVEGFKRSNLFKAILPGVIIFALLIIHQKIMVQWLGFPNLDNPRSNAAVKMIVHKPLEFVLNTSGRIVELFIYSGLFCLPFVPWLKTVSERAKINRIAKYSSIAYVVLAIISFILRGHIMPLAKNALLSIGLGPPTLRDVYLLGLPNLPKAPIWIWAIVTLVGVWAGTKVLQFIIILVDDLIEKSKVKRSEPRRALTFLLLAAIAFYSVLIITSGAYDRYLLIYIPIVAALFALNTDANAARSKLSLYVSYGVIGFYSLYGALATHDYISWNRVRWQLVDKLTTEMGVTAQQLDGGYEVNGSLNFLQEKTIADDKSWWWVTDDQYMIAFGDIPGFNTIERRTFPNYLYGEAAAVCILKRAN